MAGVSYQVKAEGLDEINRSLAVLADRFGDLTPLMQTIGMLGEVDTQDNFGGEHAPDGTPWPPSNRARETGGKTLQDSRRLYKSITHRADARSAEWGTNVIYARRHNEGWSGTEQVASHKRTMRQVFGVRLAEPIEVTVGAFSRTANTPRRQFIGLSPSLREDIADAVETYAGLPS
ncbi:phage virion morphogenesis protein [Sphingomonas sp. CJ99]